MSNNIIMLIVRTNIIMIVNDNPQGPPKIEKITEELRFTVIYTRLTAARLSFSHLHFSDMDMVDELLVLKSTKMELR